jgi:glycolate oxidase FAD binding subunit
VRGAVRDHVLGVRMLNGHGQHLRLGGTVMKNVAGFDLSRLMAGSWGTLGVLTEVSLKVLPQAVASETLQGAMPQAQAIDALNRWAGQPLPLDASCWQQGRLTLRLRGAKAAVDAAMAQFADAWPGAVTMPPADADDFWARLRDQRFSFFTPHDSQCLWRVSLPSTCPPFVVPGHASSDADVWVEWQGSQRWLRTLASAEQVMAAAKAAGGCASLWRVADAAQASVLRQAAQAVAWAQLSPVLQRWHQQVQQSFDPFGVFDTGRLWPRQQQPSR